MEKNYKYKMPDLCPECLGTKIKGSLFIYRICKSIPLNEQDFIPLQFSSLPKDIGRKNQYKGKKLCLSSGLSVHVDEQEAIQKRKKMPMLGDYIAKANVSFEGETYFTPNKEWPHHSTFYIYDEYREVELFKIL